MQRYFKDRSKVHKFQFKKKFREYIFNTFIYETALQRRPPRNYKTLPIGRINNNIEEIRFARILSHQVFGKTHSCSLNFLAAKNFSKAMAIKLKLSKQMKNNFKQ